MNSIEIKNLAKRQLDLKLSLEEQFQRELRSWFAGIRQDLRVSFAANGVVQDVQQYRPRLVGMLQTNYKRVQKAFLGQYLGRSQKQSFNLLDILNRWAIERAEQQAGFILETTERQIFETINQSRAALIAEEVVPSNLNIANLAPNILKRKTDPRVDTIATFETQNAAENTKFTEASMQPPEREPRKTWDTVGDEAVRLSHREADGQSVPIDGNFVVQGQLLRFPGDTLMGATMNNTINCRCSAIYSL